RFTSALPVQILKSMATVLMPQLEPGAGGTACQAVDEVPLAPGLPLLAARMVESAVDETGTGGETGAGGVAPLPRLRMGRVDGGAASAVPLPAAPVPPDSAPAPAPAESAE